MKSLTNSTYPSRQRTRLLEAVIEALCLGYKSIRRVWNRLNIAVQLMPTEFDSRGENSPGSNFTCTKALNILTEELHYQYAGKMDFSIQQESIDNDQG